MTSLSAPPVASRRVPGWKSSERMGSFFFPSRLCHAISSVFTRIAARSKVVGVETDRGTTGARHNRRRTIEEEEEKKKKGKNGLRR